LGFIGNILVLQIKIPQHLVQAWYDQEHQQGRGHQTENRADHKGDEDLGLKTFFKEQVKILENGGKQALVDYLQEIEKQHHSRIFLLQEDTSPFSDRKLPLGAADLVASSRKSHDIMTFTIPGTPSFRLRVVRKKNSQTLIQALAKLVK
jgi:hypothetical protein